MRTKKGEKKKEGKEGEKSRVRRSIPPLIFIETITTNSFHCYDPAPAEGKKRKRRGKKEKRREATGSASVIQHCFLIVHEHCKYDPKTEKEKKRGKKRKKENRNAIPISNRKLQL